MVILVFVHSKFPRAISLRHLHVENVVVIDRRGAVLFHAGQVLHGLIVGLHLGVLVEQLALRKADKRLVRLKEKEVDITRLVANKESVRAH